VLLNPIVSTHAGTTGELDAKARVAGVPAGLLCSVLIISQAAAGGFATSQVEVDHGITVEAASSRSTGTTSATIAEGLPSISALLTDHGLSRRPGTRPQGVRLTDPGRDLSSSTEYDLSPDISGTRVVWEQYPGRIMLHDLATGQTQAIVPPAGAENLIPSIDGDHVEFARWLSTGDWQILVHDIPSGTEHQIATYPRNHGFGRFRISLGAVRCLAQGS
jgi:hypothetical protein